MKRRIVPTVVFAIALVTALLAVEAQQAGKVWRIGFISVAPLKIDHVLFQQLRELGYVEGQNLVVERRYSGAKRSDLPSSPPTWFDSTST